ncbi:MAG TPA: NADPH-dependent assimilatory sulfite reductase hemoprotein subunit [Longimicrobium sp.]|nr:NADPH-dependent assimilatory sulfite reductase hemoprotein subunit [Longimicrobium sp.]
MSTVIDEAALSEVERVKLESHGLRGTLAEELESETTHLSEVGKTLIKFHGSYEQEDRDQRKERKRAGMEPAYSFMIRSKLPGGVLDAQQYLVHDDLADRYGNGTLRITTRQGFQFHGVLKGSLRGTIHDLNEALVTTLGACGDVVRNVVSCPAPVAGGFRREAYEMARRLSDETLPATRAYHELWVEGVKVAGGEPAPEPDPLYGERYLPRKFKVAFGYADDNCTDVYANDLGFVAIPAGDRVLGYNVVVGGGLGQTHGKEETFPRLADPLCFVEPDELIEVAKAVIAVQRDYGNRANRRRARLKYLIHEQGVAWFREQVEAYLGRAVRDPYPIEVNDIHDHLGWHRQADGRWFYGVWVQNGRVHDTPTLQLRTALRRIVEGFRPGVHLTTQQNLLLTDIADEHRDGVESILAEHGVLPKEKLTNARRWSMACPALPTCGLAVAESERALPGVIDEIEAELESLGLADERITIRMTGCPNGCARPYTADIAFVGRSLGKYLLYVGGNSQGTRLATPYQDLVPAANVVEVLRPLFRRFRDERQPGEAFGDFCSRVGVESLRAAEVAA